MVRSRHRVCGQNQAMSAAATPARRALARHLHGCGLELGPGHEPFPLPAGVEVRYVDRWSPDDNLALFPELAGAVFPVPDLIADLDADRLAAIESASVDFVIASHVLEHLADPIGMLDEMHRVLRVGGIALILLPDRRTTFDAARAPTPLGHLVEEHAAGVTAVSDEHIVEFVAAVEPGHGDLAAADIEHHRRRSIHVHCWHEEEFLPVVAYGVRSMGHRWRFVDGLRTGRPGSVGIEFGAVLRKERPDRDTGAGGDEAADRVPDRLADDWRSWFEAELALAGAHQATVAELEARISALEASASWRSTAPLRALSSRIRRLRR
jgi:SAM-dependent methyltransferase